LEDTAIEVSTGGRIANEDVLPVLDLPSNPAPSSEMSADSLRVTLLVDLGREKDLRYLRMEPHLAFNIGVVVDV
jgi:hypothetical protein